jgi:TonB family protein
MPAPHEEAESGGDVVRRVMPRVSPGAQNTIRGTIRIVVKADVDATGNVTQARLQTAGPSKYFARVALEAARDWKFKPAQANGQAVASEWVVRFGFSRRGTEGAAKRTAP